MSDIPIAIRRCFVAAAALVARYRQLGASDSQGTIQSSTLSLYRPDTIPDLPANICQIFATGADFGAELAQRLEEVDCQIALRHRLVQAVVASTNSAAALFKNLFGVSLPNAALEYLCTGTQIFFSIAYLGDELRDRRLWESLSAQERQIASQFFATLNRFSFQQFQNFPVFGICTPSRIDGEWLSQIARISGLTPAAIAQMLPRCVGTIPAHKVEAFAIHDIWGHHWQSILANFKSDYQALATCGEPLRAATTAYTRFGPLSARELFAVSGERVSLNAERAKLFFHAQVEQRLRLLFAHLIAETLADAAEFKFILDNPQAANQLISSSIFKAEPTKLDLIFNDLNYLFIKVIQPLLELHLSAVKDSELEMDLLASWSAENYPTQSLKLRTNLKQEIARLHQIFLEEYNSNYLPVITSKTTFYQIATNLVYIQNTINSLYQIYGNDRAVPIQDLLLVFVGCLVCEKTFWEVSEALSSYFLPCWHLLNESISATSFDVSAA